MKESYIKLVSELEVIVVLRYVCMGVWVYGCGTMSVSDYLGKFHSILEFLFPSKNIFAQVQRNKAIILKLIEN